jgi:transcriptional regulator with XRE-family HTH domain
LEPTSLTANFCDELRKAREYQGLSIDDISRKTKIPREYLNALEQGHLEVIPASIRRGVIAAYAQTSGMNSDKVLKTLETLQGIQPIAETGTLATDRSSRERLMVGMTRAQIRTAWFASIAGNRFLHWALTILFLLVGVLLAAQWRGGAGNVLLPAKRSIYEDGPTSSFRASPVMNVEEEPYDTLSVGSAYFNYETSVTLLDTGQVRIFWGIDEGPALEVYPYDKINVKSFSGMRVFLNRRLPGYLIADKDTLLPHFTKDSTVTWLAFPDQKDPEAADSSANADSLGG